MLGLSLALAVFLADQLVKWVVVNIFQLKARGSIELLPIFELRWVPNHGVSMGFLTAGSEGARWALVAMTAAISVFVGVWLWRERRRDDALRAWLRQEQLARRVRKGATVVFLDAPDRVGEIEREQSP